MSDSAVRIVLVFPELLGTYGDGGNAEILARRLAWRGIDVDLHSVSSRDPLPTAADVYVMGGGEDNPQSAAADALRRDGAFRAAIDNGAAVLAVCAGYQIIGERFPGVGGRPVHGAGVIDMVTESTPEPRAVGEIIVQPPAELGLGELTGFENHQGRTRLGAGVTPLGTVRLGIGNGATPGTDGAHSGRIFGTYLHGPVLARNPLLADTILAMVTGPLPPLDPDHAPVGVALHDERLRRARNGRARRRGRRSKV